MCESFWRALFVHRPGLDRQGVLEPVRVAGRDIHCVDLFCHQHDHKGNVEEIGRRACIGPCIKMENVG